LRQNLAAALFKLAYKREVDLKQRILTAVVGIPIVLLALFGPPLIADGFMAIVGAAMVYEYLNMMDRLQGLTFIPFLAFMLLMIVLGAVLPVTPLALILMALVTAGMFGIWGLGLPAWALGGALYLGIPLAVIVHLRLAEQGQAWIVVVLFITWLTDTMALFGGKTFGKTKLAPQISPNKTREGTAIGIVSGFVTGIITAMGVSLWQDHSAVVFIGSVLLPPAAVLGDLAESKIKRVYGKKDSGSLFPGHGGMLDRIDSLLFTFTLMWLILWLGGRR
jgi:phosphatidate cytidylyltransferase